MSTTEILTDDEYAAALDALDAEIAEADAELGDAALSGADTSKLAQRASDLATRRRVLVAERAAAQRKAEADAREAARGQVESLRREYLSTGAEQLRRLAALRKAELSVARARAAYEAHDMPGGVTARERMRTVHRRVLRLDRVAAMNDFPNLPGPLNDGGDLSPAEMVALAREWDALADADPSAA